MKIFFPYSIKKKIWFIAFLIILLFMVEGGGTFFLSKSTQSYLDPDRVKMLTMLVRLEKFTELIRDILSEYALTGETAQLKEAQEIANQAHSLISEMKISFPENFEFYDSFNILFGQYLEKGNRLAADNFYSQPYDPELARSVKDTYNTLHDNIEMQIVKRRDRLLKIFNEANINFSKNYKILLFITVLVTVLVFILIRASIRAITGPISILEKATKSLGDGNLNITVRIDSKDEFAALADSFNYMVTSLREKTTYLEDARNNLSKLLAREIEMERELRQANKAYRIACQDLQRANKAKSEFLANMSHEFRTPMNAIINFTDQVVEDWEELFTDEDWKSEAYNMLKRVIRSSSHLLSMINDLLDIAKIESGKVTLNITACSLSSLLQDIVAEVSSLAREKGISIRMDIPKALPEFYCDGHMIKQALINLMSNAIKFTDRGYIVIKVSPKDREEYFIEVIDTGIGIPEEDIDAIFDRFHQVDSSGARKYHGTGIGLNLVWEIMRLHGGDITVKSNIGEGSIFTITLPVNAKIHEELQKVEVQ